MNNPFVGTGTALVTPFNKDLSIDFDSLSKLTEYQIDSGVDILVVQGTTGESPTLSFQEKLQVLKSVQDVNNGRRQIVFGVGGNDTVGVGKLLKELPTGIDGILSVSPYYNKPTQRGIIEHYKHVAGSTDLPIILYNVPGRTGSNMSADTTLALAKIPNIVAMKEASGDFSQIMKLVQDKPEGFDVLSGDDAITFPLICTGVSGVISVVSNAFPALFSQMVAAARAGEVVKAKEIHYKLLEITHMFFAEGNPGGVKVALNEMGIMGTTMRQPLYPVSDELESNIRQATKSILS